MNFNTHLCREKECRQTLLYICHTFALIDKKLCFIYNNATFLLRAFYYPKWLAEIILIIILIMRNNCVS